MRNNARRVAAAVLVAGMALALSACLLSPGRFASTLDLRRDGRFTFTYNGEISMLALGKLAAMADKDAAQDKFDPTPCHDEAMDERPCKADELATQRREWEQERSSRAERKAREAEQMKALLGGIDPSSPEAASELAGRMRRQAGWKSVVYKGDGLFLVDFALTGRLDHDFSFPTIERLPTANPFVQLTRRADGSVRVEAPGFTPATATGNPFAAMLGGLAGTSAEAKAPPLPALDGSFTVTTDGAVLANNTDEGPQPDPAGQRLTWRVTPRAGAAPTALVRLTN